ncbi:MAG: rod shape-determining protein MreC [Thermosulfidibacteraceae bacterium]
MKKVVFLYLIIVGISVYLLRLQKSIPTTYLLDLPWKISSKLYNTFYSVKSEGKSIIKTHIDATKIIQENEKLKIENTELRIKLQSYYYFKEENEKLRSLLNIKSQIETTIPVEVSSWIGEYWEQKFVLNKGKKDGLKEGMALIGGNGIVGMIVKVEEDRAIAISNTDPSFAIHVEDFRSKVKGIARGNGYYMNLNFVPPTMDVKPGDLLISTGIEGIFPPGIVVGRVIEVQKRIDSKFLEIKVVPTDSILTNRIVLAYKKGDK